MTPEFTYEQWCKRSHYLLAQAEKYNVWREKAKLRLLTDIAPRVGKLSQQFYMGCGFHYGMEQQLGKLISLLALPIEFSANHCAKIPDHLACMAVNEVMMAGLVRDVVNAERSVDRVK